MMSSSSSPRPVIVCLVLLGAMTSASPAGAVSKFPGEVHSDLGLDYDPPCRLCHIHGTTGSGSVATPFGISMLAHGLTQDQGTLAPALQALRADGVDSDGDGVPDITELIANTDPNTPADVALSSDTPTYGCSVAVGGPDGLVGMIFSWTLLGVPIFLPRRRRKHDR